MGHVKTVFSLLTVERVISLHQACYYCCLKLLSAAARHLHYFFADKLLNQLGYYLFPFPVSSVIYQTEHNKSLLILIPLWGKLETWVVANLIVVTYDDRG